MSKGVWVFALTMLCSLNVYAETYHGIDIDKVYSQSDWSNKDKIKEIVDDYSLLLQFKKDLNQCQGNDHSIECMNQLAQNIMQHFYSHNYENNIQDYQNYVKSTLAVYGVAYCLNKYNFPAGAVCEQEKNAQVCDVIKQYIETLLSQIEKQISIYSFIKDYK